MLRNVYYEVFVTKCASYDFGSNPLTQWLIVFEPLFSGEVSHQLPEETRNKNWKITSLHSIYWYNHRIKKCLQYTP